MAFNPSTSEHAKTGQAWITETRKRGTAEGPNWSGAGLDLARAHKKDPTRRVGSLGKTRSKVRPCQFFTTKLSAVTVPAVTLTFLEPA